VRVIADTGFLVAFASRNEEGRTKSELFREALRRWRALQRYGATQMRRLGLTEVDIERTVDESRRAPARAPRHR
jgi:hypothetical protein